MSDMSYMALVLITLVIGFGVTSYVKSRLKKYGKIGVSTGLTGLETAQAMLAYHGVQGVSIHQGSKGQDHFDPRKNAISLGPEVYSGRSITATATACHEVGHALQMAESYAPFKIRSMLVPAVGLASNAWMFLLMAGIFLNIVQLVELAIVFYSVAVLFQLVTLPVEFNASKRAMVYLEATGFPQAEQSGTFSVLRACALTYVAAALTSILQLLWLLGKRN